MNMSIGSMAKKTFEDIEESCDNNLTNSATDRIMNEVTNYFNSSPPPPTDHYYVQHRVYSRWMHYSELKNSTVVPGEYWCALCKNTPLTDFRAQKYILTKFCPCCGAEMINYDS